MAQPPQPSNPLLTLDGINFMAPNVARAATIPSKVVNSNEIILNYPQFVSFLSKNVPVPEIDVAKLPVIADPPLVIPEGQKVIYPPEPTTRLPFLNRVALVVGGSKNIGRAIANYLGDQGYIVVATSRKPSSYTQSENPYLSQIPLDIRDQTSVDNFFKRVIAPLGRVDYLILCSGIHWKSLIPGVNSDDMKAYFQIKPIGFHRCIYASLPYLRLNPNSRVLCMSSIAGGQNSQYAGLGFYNVVNHALTMYTYQANMDERFMYAFGAIENPVTYICVTPGLILSTIGSYDHYLNKSSVPKSITDSYHINIAALQTSLVPGFPAEPCETVAKQIFDIISAPQPGFNYIVGNTNEQFLGMPLVDNLQLGNQMPDIDYINTFSNPLTTTLLNTPTVDFLRTSLYNLYAP